MHFIIGNKGLRVFCKALRFIAKYSNDLYLEAHPDFFQLKACTPTQRAVICAKFDIPFFLKYELSDDSKDNYAKVSIRSLLTSIKNWKNIAGYTLVIDNDRDLIGVNIKKDSGVEVILKINLLECEELQSVPIILDNASEVSCGPSIFKRFQGSSSEIRELRMQFEENTVLVENYIENPDDDCSTVRLHYLLHSSEFTCYDLKQETSIVFGWSEFNHVVDMAQQLECDIRINFIKPGKVMHVTVDTGSNYSIQMTESTMSNEVINRQKQCTKVVTYKDRVNKYAEDQGLEITGSKLGKVMDPQINGTNSEVGSQKNAQQENNEEFATNAGEKSPKRATFANNTIVSLSLVEEDELQQIRMELEQLGEIDKLILEETPPNQTPKRSHESEDSLESYRLQSSRQKHLEQQQKKQLSEEQFFASKNFVPSDLNPDDNILIESPPDMQPIEDVDKLHKPVLSERMPANEIAERPQVIAVSRQEKKGMFQLKREFKPRVVELDKVLELKHGRSVTAGSDTDESVLE